ncbi:protein-L-isoaspartate(D-aspartate) O-methyltransferase [Thermodesulfobacteriota bacterium]
MKKILVIVLLIFFPSVILADFKDDTTKFKLARQNMVAKQIRRRGITDPKILAAMSEVPRHLFVPKSLRGRAYLDRPLPIGEGQTISQPYIVALMTESLKLTGNERILEIGTGSGYQAAILARIVKEVYTIEIKKKIYKRATEVLQMLQFTNIKTRQGDGYFGWDQATPFDSIMITAAIDHIPPPLLQQLKNGGRLILPLGNPLRFQNLTLVTKYDDDYTVKQITGVLFVPMTGYALEPARNALSEPPR